MRSFLAAGLLLALVPSAPLPAAAQGEAFGTSPPLLSPDQRGTRMERGAAERALRFRPFVPDASPSEVVLLPPFHASSEWDTTHSGIAYTYWHHGRTWVLSEWPRNGGDLSAFAALPAERGCADVRAVGGQTKPRGLVWSTPRGLVMSLVPDESATAQTIRAEFRRLVPRGACR